MIIISTIKKTFRILSSQSLRFRSNFTHIAVFTKFRINVMLASCACCDHGIVLIVVHICSKSEHNIYKTFPISDFWTHPLCQYSNLCVYLWHIWHSGFLVSLQFYSWSSRALFAVLLNCQTSQFQHQPVLGLRMKVARYRISRSAFYCW